MRARGERGSEAWALRLGALVALAGDPPDIALAAERVGEARDLARALEMRPLLAHCHLGLGELYRRTGALAHAREELTRAAAMYRDRNMRFWLDTVEPELEQLG